MIPEPKYKIHDSQVFKTKSHDMIHDSASNPDRNKTLTNIYLGKVRKKYVPTILSIVQL